MARRSRLVGRPIPTGRTATTLTALFRFKGQTLTEPPADVSVGIMTMASDHLPPSPALLAVIDSSSAVWLGAVYRDTLGTGTDAVETLAAHVPLATFLTLAGARTATIRAGHVDIPLTAEDLEALRDLASRMSPSAGGNAPQPPGPPTRVLPRSERDWYEATEVDTPARPSTLPEHPRFPDVPAGERRRRELFVEFVVDTAGHAQLVNVRGRDDGSIAPFVDALRAVMAHWEYEPARKGGVAVPQVIRQVVVFDPPPGE
jgi:hypothetical protein